MTALHRVGADAQVTTLAERAVANADPNDLHSTSALLVTMHAVGREQLVRDLLRSDPVARVDPAETSVVADLLGSLLAVGADTEVSTLLARDPAAYADQNDPLSVMGFLLALGAYGTETVSTALLDRLPGAGAFEAFLHYSKLAGNYRFGRAHDGRPAAPWGWDDLE